MTDTKPSLVTFPAGTTDQEKAAIYRSEALPLLEAICSLRDRARKDGLIIGFSLAWDQFGRSVVSDLNIVKPL
jgi:hypothetical protein